MKESKELNAFSFEKIQSSRYYDSHYYDRYLVVAPEGSTREEMFEYVRKEIGTGLGIRAWSHKDGGWYVEVCTD